MARTASKSVFLNIPYENSEELFLTFTTGLTMLGLVVQSTLAVPPDSGRLTRIIRLIRRADYSIHDLSRINSSEGLPRFNMPLELGVALYREATERGKHRVYIFEQERYRIQRSTSDVNGLDVFIHSGRPRQVIAEFRNIFVRESHASTVPQMISAFEGLKKALPAIREKAGSQSLFEAAIFKDILLTLSFSKREHSRSTKHLS